MSEPSGPPHAASQDSHDGAPELIQRSRVKFTTNAKGMVQTEVTVVAGTTENEMQGILDIALRAYNAATRSIGARAAGP